jgi:hypothetical protein
MVHELITHTILTKDRQALARIIADAAALADWQALDFCDDRDVCRCDRTGSNDEPTKDSTNAKSSDASSVTSLAKSTPISHAQKRTHRPSPQPLDKHSEHRTLPPNPQTLAQPTTSTHRPHRHANPARHLPRHLQHRTHPPSPPRTTPAQAYTKAAQHQPPSVEPTEHFHIRHDTVGDCGKLTLRYASRLHHLGIGRVHAGTKVLILVTTTVTVLATAGHQLIASHHIDPDRNYWRNQQNAPADGRGDL